MMIQRLPFDFSVCKVTDFSSLPLQSPYCFVGKTEEENSLVCLTQDVPANTTAREDGWKAFRVQGVLDFSLVGILAELSTLLAKHEIGLFAVSTYNTDYILVKEKNFEKALQVLADAGHTVTA